MFDEKIKIKMQGNTFFIKESHLHQHRDVQVNLRETLAKFLSNDEKYEDFQTIKICIDLGQVIGKTSCVSLENVKEEDVFYAQRKGRTTLTKFVKNIPAKDCSCITLVMKKNNKKYNILTAYIGMFAQKEPLDQSIKTKEEFEICKSFWSTHALIEGSQKIYKNTITSKCPWDSFENRPTILIGNNNDINKILQNLEKPSIIQESSVQIDENETHTRKFKI